MIQCFCPAGNSVESPQFFCNFKIREVFILLIFINSDLASFAVMGVGRRKSVACPPGFWNLTFSSFIFNKIGCFLSFEREKLNFTTFSAPWKNRFCYLWKNPLLTPLENNFRRPFLLVLWIVMITNASRHFLFRCVRVATLSILKMIFFCLCHF